MFSSCHATAAHRFHCCKLSALPTLTVLATSLSCARLPPSSGALSGKRIHVVMTFASGMDPNFYYYFLINKYGTKGTFNARGPIPVLSPNPSYGGYGNGYATGSQGGVGNLNGVTDYGITDFVLYNISVPVFNGNIGLYHYTADPNTQPTPPIVTGLRNVVLPDTSATALPQAANTLSFDVYVSQLVTDTTSTAAIAQEAQNIQYLQVNIVATNRIPFGQTTDNPNKQVDAMGNTLDPNQQTAFLQIDLTQDRSYSSADNISGLAEPSNDVYPGGQTNTALDLTSWSITVNPGS